MARTPARTPARKPARTSSRTPVRKPAHTSSRTPAGRRPRPPSQAAAADRLALYETAVQSPDADVEFLERVLRHRGRRLPATLREDFCGTALLASAWVRRRPGNVAVGVDLHGPTLRWAERHNRAPLGAEAARLRLIQGDVRRARGPRADLAVAMNFSYWCLRNRADLVAYFRHVRTQLLPGGVLVLDAFGGTEAPDVAVERRRCKGFTYEWEQADFDPVSGRLRCRIHFEFRDGSAIRPAFSYDWRLWSLPEVQDALAEAGFGRFSHYFESTDRKGDGTGHFRQVRRYGPCQSFIAYLVAQRP